jgi:dynein heavy chain
VCTPLPFQVTTDQQEAEKVKILVAAEEQEIGVMQQHTQAMAEDAKADLAEAMPALQAAIDSLKALNKNDITEIKSFTKPPALVQVSAPGSCGVKAYA